MINELRPYQTYKDSGVPWLGEVPEHWGVLPSRALFEEVKERDHPDEQMLSVTITQGVIRQSTLLEGTSKKDSSNLDRSAYKLVCPRDIVYNKMRAWQGAIGASAFRGIVSPAYVVVRLRQDNDPRYFHYVFRTPQFAKEAERWSYGITSDMWSLRPEHFRMIYCTLPPRGEQSAIVRFLDHAERQIRGFIRAKQKLIKLLEEQKQVIIHRSVTRGLDPNARMKASGIEWLGEIPEKWTACRLKAVLVRPMRNGLFKKRDAFGQGVPLVNVSDIYRRDFRIESGSLERVQASSDEVQTFQVQPGDLFFVRSSLKLEGTGRSAFVSECEPDTVFECHVVQGRPDPVRANPRFLALQLNSFALRHYLISRANSVTMSTVAQDVLSSCPVWLPSLEEQDRILRWIDRESEVLDSVSTKAEAEIALCREYRSRLVTDVVTGRFDVREAAAHLPEEPEEEPPAEEIEVRDMDQASGIELEEESAEEANI
jgi:type I restriction enzyme S subunit